MLIVPPVWVAIYRVVPPPVTILMVERSLQGKGLDHRWRPLDRIAPAMTRAVVASEDARFCSHHGFDIQAIDAALRHNEERARQDPRRIDGQPADGEERLPLAGAVLGAQGRGGLVHRPDRGDLGQAPDHGGLSQHRRMGSGIYGVEAASERYFHEPASRLTPAQADRLAAILPSPLKWSAAHPGAYVRKRTGKIGARSGTVARGGLADCVLG